MSSNPVGAKSAADLASVRKASSVASGGTSSDVLYHRVIGEFRRRSLGGAVLDFGAGTGNLVALLAQQEGVLRIAAADLFEAPALQKGRVDWIVADLNDPLPVAPNAFDVVLSVETIEHLENPRAVVREWYRLLKPGGTLIFTTPNNDNVRSVLTVLVKGHFQQFTDEGYPAHITALLTKDVERITREAGFVDLEIDYAVPGRLYWGIYFNHLLPFGSRVGKRTAMTLIASCRKPV
jgi:2-polyprenyl-3-methyl-5-hydroxy-6-metoxy-1,4-benzoquinol methylase